MWDVRESPSQSDQFNLDENTSYGVRGPPRHFSRQGHRSRCSRGVPTPVGLCGAALVEADRLPVLAAAVLGAVVVACGRAAAQGECEEDRQGDDSA